MYLAREDFARWGVCEEEILRGEATAGFRALMAEEVGRARELFADGAAAVASVGPGARPGMRMARAVYLRVLDRVERLEYDVLGAPRGPEPMGGEPRDARARCEQRRDPARHPGPRRAVADRAAGRGRAHLRRELRRPGGGARAGRIRRRRSARGPLRGGRAPDVGVRGAHSVAARHGRGGGDTPGAALHVLPHPPRIGALPAAVELVVLRLPRALPPAARAVRRSLRDREGGAPPTATLVLTDRGELRAPLVVDALGWRRVLAGDGYQPPDAPLSRGLEVHPEGGGEDLDVWVDRSLVRHGYCWSVPADGEQRVGAGSYEPRHHVRRPTEELASRLSVPAGSLPGQLVPPPPAPRGRGRGLLRG